MYLQKEPNKSYYIIGIKETIVVLLVYSTRLILSHIFLSRIFSILKHQSKISAFLCLKGPNKYEYGCLSKPETILNILILKIGAHSVWSFYKINCCLPNAARLDTSLWFVSFLYFRISIPAWSTPHASHSIPGIFSLWSNSFQALRILSWQTHWSADHCQSHRY